MTAAVTHVMRAPIVGGSELETLAITLRLAAFRHHVLFPRRFEAWEPSIRDRFPEGATVEGVDDLEERLASLRSGLVHVQFPFLIHPTAPHHDSVLVFRGLHDRLAVPVVFTVHAAVNVPVLPHIHYVFHTEEQAARFGSAIERERITICPSLVEVPDQAPARNRDGAVRILWVSRNEAGKFHPDVSAIVGEVLEACPEAHFRFVGVPPVGLPHAGERVTGVACPAPRLAEEWAQADVFWYFPHPLLEETWCRTVTEAMAHGLPCVVAAHGAMRVQVRHGIEGSVAADTRSCAAAIVALVRDRAARLEMGAAGVRRAREFQAQAEQTWSALYSRLSQAAARERQPC